jgi:deoxyribonuclease (pyrimidine dimer)
MTRINVGMLPMELTRQHLIAEHREIKRIPNLIKRGRLLPGNIPTKFTLNKGHVKFFYDKQLYLLKRYQSIYYECKKRGYNVTDFSNAWNNIPDELMNDYNPTNEDRQIIIERINEKLGIKYSNS